jgi:hypothetical protein
MNCRDVQDIADSFLREELLTHTNRDILVHLGTCGPCRAEIEGRRRLRSALRVAINRTPELQPPADFGARLRSRLHNTSDEPPAISAFPWLGVAAGIALAASLAGGIFLNRTMPPADALARDAIGDHWNCALKFRLIRRPVPLEEASKRFDGAFRVLLSVPPDDFSTPGGPARVVERHSCAYGARRFGHVVMQYRGRVVSLLVTVNAPRAESPVEPDDPVPHLIGRPMNRLSVVSVTGSRHAVLLVSDLGSTELTQLSEFVSLPLTQRLEDFNPNRSTPVAFLIAQPSPGPALVAGER